MKYAIADVSTKELDKLIMPCKPVNTCNINLRSGLVYKIGNFTLNLGLSHKYAQQSKDFGSKVVPWKTVFEKKCGKKLMLTERQLFDLYNYVTTAKSCFGHLIRKINEKSSDEWNARYFYDHGHSLTSINMPYRDTCFKYCHKFPRRIQTSCPGRCKCNAEKACSCTDKKCGGKKSCGPCGKKKCVSTKCH